MRRDGCVVVKFRDGAGRCSNGTKIMPLLDLSERQSSSCEQVCNKASFFFSRSSLWVSKSWIEASTLILDKGLQPCSLYQSQPGY
jgi:hypothetical protein